jgi:hypothetical protein
MVETTGKVASDGFFRAAKFFSNRVIAYSNCRAVPDEASEKADEASEKANSAAESVR